MKLPFEFLIGLTYTKSGRRGRKKDRFMSFISMMSVSSIAVGVAALIIVLSVMNGFQKEVRDRMLSVLAHVEVVKTDGPLKDTTFLLDQLKEEPLVIGTAPYVQGQGLINYRNQLRGVLIKGIEPADEVKVSDIESQMQRSHHLSSLTPKSFHIVIGRTLARILQVDVGDKLSLMVPRGNVTPAGMIPRFKDFTVSGIFSSGHYEYDSSMVLMHLDDAALLLRTGGAQGLRLKLSDMNEAPMLSHKLRRILPMNYWASDWSEQNRTWFAAVQVEKRMMSIILFLIVLVGAFGLVSSLVMTVKEKQNDIAILRTLGASSSAIMKIFVVQGVIVGIVGITLGVGLGLLVAYNVGDIVAGIEALLGVQFLPQEIYFISQMPSDPRLSDIIPIAIFSFFLSLIATLYPSWRASKIQPAEALRYE